ncbi:MAG: FkbM family methyltransferase [Bacteroidota bacterium]
MLKQLFKKSLQFVLGKESGLYLRLYHLYKPSRFPSLNHLIDTYAKQKEEIVFVQIGANEGQVEDPIYYHIRMSNWRGILVEPQQAEFELLKKNYRHSAHLHFEQLAISDRVGERKFYYIEKDKGNVPHWVSKLSSFDESIPRQVLERYPQAQISHTMVQCTTLMELLAKHQIEKLDFLMIDTEGHDYEILKTLDLDRYRPEVIIFENNHLSKSDYQAALDQLSAKGYLHYQFDYNTASFTHTELVQSYRTQLLVH